MSDWPRKLCKLGCGQMIVWAEIDGSDGKAVPLDPKPAVYRLVEEDGKLVAVRLHDAMVNHFATCQGIRDGKRP